MMRRLIGRAAAVMLAAAVAMTPMTALADDAVTRPAGQPETSVTEEAAADEGGAESVPEETETYEADMDAGATTGTGAGTYAAGTQDAYAGPEIIGVSEALVPDEYVTLMDTSTATVTSTGEAVRYNGYGYGTDIGWYTRSISASITGTGLFHGVCLNPTLTALRSGDGTSVVQVTDSTSEPMTRLRRALFYYHMDTAGGQPNMLTELCGTDWHPKYIVMHCTAAMINGDPNWAYGASDALRTAAQAYHDWLLTQGDAPTNFVTYISADPPAGRQAYAFYRLEEEPEPEAGQAYLKISKKSTEPERTDGNANYTLAGARYGIFANADDADPVQVLETGEDGATPVSGAITFTGDSVTVYVRELEAPDGFRLDTTATAVTLTPDSTAESPYTLETDDVPQVLRIIVRKTDADGNALEGAVFAVYGPGEDGTDVRLGQMTDDGGGNYYYLVYSGTNSPSDYSVVEEAAPEGYDVGSVSRYDVGCENEDYITRLFEGFLGRTPSTDEVRSYNALIQSGMTFAQAAHEVLESDEASDVLSAMTREEAVRMLYRTLLDREAADSEVVGTVDADGSYKTAAEFAAGVAEGILGSDEFAALCGSLEDDDAITAYVEGLYTELGITGRDAAEDVKAIRGDDADNTAAKRIIMELATSGTYLSADGAGRREIVRRLYAGILSREASEAEVNAWIAEMDQVRAFTIAVADTTFLGSDEFRTGTSVLRYGDFIDAAYMELFGHKADAEGKKSWALLMYDGLSGTDVISRMAKSDEFAGIAGDLIADGDYAGLINRIYRAMLGRNADPAGLADWTARLEAGAAYTDIVDGIAGSAEARAAGAAYMADMTVENDETRPNLAFSKQDAEGNVMTCVPFLITDEATGEAHVVMTSNIIFDKLAKGDVNTYATMGYEKNILDGYVEGRVLDLSKITEAHLDTVTHEAVGTWFGEGDPGESGGAFEYGHTYLLQELYVDFYDAEGERHTNAGRELKDIRFTITQDDVTEDGTYILDIGTITDEEPELHTTAASYATGDAVMEADAGAVITDTVTYDRLTAGLEYVLKAELVRKDTGEAVAEGSLAFTPESATGTVTVELAVDASELAGTDLVVFETAYHMGVEVASHADIDDEGQTVHIPKMGTTATDTATGTHSGGRSETASITDTVTYTNLVPGKEYTVTGTLMDRDTGGALHDASGGTITAEATFTPEAADGSVDLTYTVDSTLLEGVTVVVFEDLFHNGVRVATHADITDEEQSVHYPKIGTTATSDGGKSATAEGTVTITDTVEYWNLIPGLEYTLTGTLMDKATGGALPDASGGTITAEATFTPEAADGTVEMTFTFDADGLEGDVVVFETLTIGPVTVATHEDIEDEGQTVTLTAPETPTPTETQETAETAEEKTGTSTGETVHTGDGAPYAPWVILAGAALAATGVIWRRRRQK